MRKYGSGSMNDGSIVAPPYALPYASASFEKSFPTQLQYESGVEPLDTYPAKWFNKFQEYYTAQWLEQAKEASDLYGELTNLLLSAGMAPDKNTNNQIAQAVDTLITNKTEFVNDSKVNFSIVPLANLTTGDSLGEIMGKLLGWWPELVKTDISTKVVSTITASVSTDELGNTEPMSTIVGKLNSWLADLKSASSAILGLSDKLLPTVTATSTTAKIAADDSMAVIAGKLNRWYDDIASAASGLVATASKTVAFTAATTLANVASGESLATMMGKLSKMYTDLTTGNAFVLAKNTSTVAFTAGTYGALTSGSSLATLFGVLAAYKAQIDSALAVKSVSAPLTLTSGTVAIPSASATTDGYMLQAFFRTPLLAAYGTGATSLSVSYGNRRLSLVSAYFTTTTGGVRTLVITNSLSYSATIIVTGSMNLSGAGNSFTLPANGQISLTTSVISAGNNQVYSVLIFPN
jgi:hypothetical protein